ncbi:MAG: hypothetical protein HZA90_24345 [Verrucomicrobia bacterium]|nr:hypothetical protein [Verrucomicrobiota bacterium]
MIDDPQSEPGRNQAPDKKDNEIEMRILQAKFDTFEKALRESNQTIRVFGASMATVLTVVALALVGWNVFRTVWSMPEEKTMFRRELSDAVNTQVVSARSELETNLAQRFIANQKAFDERIHGISNSLQAVATQLASGNNMFMAMQAVDRAKQADTWLRNSNYLDATVNFAVSTSWFLKTGYEPDVHTGLTQLTKRCLPQLNNEHLEMPSRAYLVNMLVSAHLTNLIIDLEKADQNARYTLEIAELKSAVRQAQARK